MKTIDERILYLLYYFQYEEGDTVTVNTRNNQAITEASHRPTSGLQVRLNVIYMCTDVSTET